MTNKLLLLSTLFAFLATGCYNDDPVVINNVEDEFYIDFWEELNTDSRSFLINIKTIDEKECENYIINYSASTEDNVTTLTLNNFELEGECEAGSAPASALYKFDKELTGSNSIQINLQDAIENNGTINVDDDMYTILMSSNIGIEVARRELHRVPENTIWGFISYSTTQEAAKCNQILTEIENYAKLSVQFNEGYYGYFDIEKDNSIQVYNKTPEFNHVISFIYNYDKSLKDSLKDLLENYDDDEKIQIYVLNDQGENLLE